VICVSSNGDKFGTIDLEEVVFEFSGRHDITEVHVMQGFTLLVHEAGNEFVAIQRQAL